jgi:replicative DNA helicase
MGQNSILKKLPPQSIEAEQAVLGGILLDENAFTIAQDMLLPEHFYKAEHTKIYSVMLEMYRKDKPIDILTLTDELKKKGDLEDVGGASYITMLAEFLPSVANYKSYCSLVYEKAVLRSLINSANRIIEQAYGQEEETSEIVDKSQQLIFSVSEKVNKRDYKHIKEVMYDTLELLNKLASQDKHIAGIPTHFEDLDKKTSGLNGGELIIIAGRPGMGKTSFALNIAYNVASQENVGVAIFSLEMSLLQLSMRFLSMVSGINSSKLKNAYLTDEELEKLTISMDHLSQLPIYLDYSAPLSLMDLKTKIRRLKSFHNVELVIIDYLQLMKAGKRVESRQQEVSEISRSLKTLALEMNIPIIALSQLSRAVEQRNDKKPMMSDLRESGSIEQDADMILFLYRDEYYNPDSPEKGIAEIMIGKQRNGPMGISIKVVFDNESTTFHDIYHGEVPDDYYLEEDDFSED